MEDQRKIEVLTLSEADYNVAVDVVKHEMEKALATATARLAAVIEDHGVSDVALMTTVIAPLMMRTISVNIGYLIATAPTDVLPTLSNGFLHAIDEAQASFFVGLETGLVALYPDKADDLIREFATMNQRRRREKTPPTSH